MTSIPARIWVLNKNGNHILYSSILFKRFKMYRKISYESIHYILCVDNFSLEVVANDCFNCLVELLVMATMARSIFLKSSSDDGDGNDYNADAEVYK